MTSVNRSESDRSASQSNLPHSDPQQSIPADLSMPAKTSVFDLLFAADNRRLVDPKDASREILSELEPELKASILNPLEEQIVTKVREQENRSGIDSQLFSSVLPTGSLYEPALVVLSERYIKPRLDLFRRIFPDEDQSTVFVRCLLGQKFALDRLVTETGQLSFRGYLNICSSACLWDRRMPEPQANRIGEKYKIPAATQTDFLDSTLFFLGHTDARLAGVFKLAVVNGLAVDEIAGSYNSTDIPKCWASITEVSRALEKALMTPELKSLDTFKARELFGPYARGLVELHKKGARVLPELSLLASTFGLTLESIKDSEAPEFDGSTIEYFESNSDRAVALPQSILDRYLRQPKQEPTTPKRRPRQKKEPSDPTPILRKPSAGRVLQSSQREEGSNVEIVREESRLREEKERIEARMKEDEERLQEINRRLGLG